METAGKNVEAWMSEVELAMAESVRKAFEVGTQMYPTGKVPPRFGNAQECRREEEFISHGCGAKTEQHSLIEGGRKSA